MKQKVLKLLLYFVRSYPEWRFIWSSVVIMMVMTCAILVFKLYFTRLTINRFVGGSIIYVNFR